MQKNIVFALTFYSLLHLIIHLIRGGNYTAIILDSLIYKGALSQ